MARRKPSGIIDVVKDIVSPWLGTPPAEFKQVTQAKALARGAAETLDQTVAGGMVKAGVQGDKALVKQAAVNAAALGVGYIAGKAVQKTLPLVQSKIGQELGVHLSNTDKLRKIKFSAQRAGLGSGYENVEINQTYKFAPYHHVEPKKIDSMKGSGKVFARTSMEDLGKKVAATNIDMANIAETKTKNFAYITKSKPGVSDPDFNVYSQSYMVPKQKVLQKIPLRQIDYSDVPASYFEGRGTSKKELDLYDETTKSITNALLKQQANMQANLRTTLNTVRGVTGVAAQQAGTKKVKRR